LEKQLEQELQLRYSLEAGDAVVVAVAGDVFFRREEGAVVEEAEVGADERGEGG
jgi:1,2-phenylacetyl-CoA epoxidase PaaB subunit